MNCFIPFYDLCGGSLALILINVPIGSSISIIPKKWALDVGPMPVCMGTCSSSVQENAKKNTLNIKYIGDEVHSSV
jgi:hypothetical protein